MDRMKTFLIYLVLLVGFFLVSVLLENGLLYNMYVSINGDTNGTLITSDGNVNSDLTISVEEAKASNVSGNLKIKITNTSGHFIERCYAKIDLYSRQDLLAATKYVEINNFEVNETRNYEIKFKAKEIARYQITIIENAPDKSNIINILGWEIDLSNVFGMDLTRFADLFSVDGIKSGLSNAWQFTMALVSSIPVWAWCVAAGIVIWFMPRGYLFGIFPF